MLLRETRALTSQYSDGDTGDSIVLKQRIVMLRASMTDIHDYFTEIYPNEYLVLMTLLVYIYAVMIILGYPLILFNREGDDPLGCVQPIIFLGVFFTLISLNIPTVLFQRLKNPFTENGKGIEIKEIIGSSELTVFHTMRSSFHMCADGRGSEEITNVRSRRRMSGTIKGGFGEL